MTTCPFFSLCEPTKKVHNLGKYGHDVLLALLLVMVIGDVE